MDVKNQTFIHRSFLLLYRALCYLTEWLKRSQLFNFEQMISLAGRTQVLAPSQELSGFTADRMVDVLGVLRGHWFVVVALLRRNTNNQKQRWLQFKSKQIKTHKRLKMKAFLLTRQNNVYNCTFLNVLKIRPLCCLQSSWYIKKHSFLTSFVCFDS